jgi:glycosyltransferase involved in cell wall biosynthesis
MTTSIFTLVILQRERFSMTQVSLESLLASRVENYPVIVMDGNSPAETASYLQEQCQLHGFDYLRFDHFLTHNQAINLIFPKIQTPYVVFCDNDLLFSQNWAEILVQCAQETGSTLVMPLYLEQDRAGTRIHMAGGYGWAEKTTAGRRYQEDYWLMAEPISAADTLPKRYPVQFLEYHAFCLSCEAFKKYGPLDENLTVVIGHVDFSLVLGGMSGKIMADRSAHVTYLRPPPIISSDREFYTQVWSEAWIDLNMNHFSKKWQVIPLRRPWFSFHRQLWLLRFLPIPLSLIPLKLRNKVEQKIIRLLGYFEAPMNRAAIRDLSAFGPISPATPAFDYSVLPERHLSRDAWLKQFLKVPSPSDAVV